METFNTTFEITEAINCPLYVKGDRMSLTDKTFCCPEGKEVCLILIRDMTQLLFTLLGEPAKESGELQKVYTCSGCTGLIKFMEVAAEDDGADAGQQANQLRALMQELHGRAAESAFLEALPAKKIPSVLAKFQQLITPHGTLLVRQGEPNHNLYLILSGSFDIELSGKRIDTLKAGEIFGEMSYLGADQAVATVRASEDSLVFAISAEDFSELLSDSISVQLFMAKLLAARLQQVNAARAKDFDSAMSGKLSEVVPAELFQVFHMHQKTGVLEMNLAEGEARVSFREGCLINASYGERKNQDAVFAMLAEKEGYYRFTSGLNPQEMKAAEIGDFMALLMEGVRRVDEVSGR